MGKGAGDAFVGLTSVGRGGGGFQNENPFSGTMAFNSPPLRMNLEQVKMLRLETTAAKHAVNPFAPMEGD